MRIFFWIFFLAVVPIFAGATSAGIPDSGRKGRTGLMKRVARQASRTPSSTLLVTPSLCTFGRNRDGGLATCGWNASSTGGTGGDWTLSSGRSAYFRGGPSADASGDPEGGYLVVETSSSQQGPAALLGPLLNATRPEGRCVVFQYAMDGPSVERLRLTIQQPPLPSVHQLANDTVVLLAPPNSGTLPTRREALLWETPIGTGDEWRTAAVLYSHGQQHHLMLEAVADDSTPSGKRLRGHVALDNLDPGTWADRADDEAINGTASPDQGTLLMNPCLGHCNFDGGFCGWSNDQLDDDFDWKLGRGSINAATGPSRDRGNFGSGSPSRGYAYIDSGYPRVPGDRARLLSPQMEATGPDDPLCLRFWTHLLGNGIGSLRVVIQSGSEGGPTVNREVWSLTGEAGNVWHQGQLTVASPTPFRVVFEAATGRNHLGDIAIDDVSFSPGPCPSAPQAAASHQGDCNFEADECGWSNAGSREASDEIDWSRMPAESSRQAPFKDHTTHTGKGFVMSPVRSAGGVQRPGDRAWLISRPFNVSSSTRLDQRCLTFWYFMNEPIIDPAGPSLGSLRIYIRREEPVNMSSGIMSSVIQQRTIWRLHNHQGSSWKMGRALIQQSSSYQVVIEALWGSSRSAGSIAMDDISFYEGTCTTSPDEATPMITECTFDRDTCGWRHNGTLGRPDALEWRLATASRRPANLPDHTFGAPSGYVYFDVFSQQSRQEVVRLVGPNMTAPGANGTERPQLRLCLTFWFAAFGAGDTTQLRVVVLDQETSSEQEIWMLRVGQLDRSDWNFGQVELEGVAGGSASGDPRWINVIFEGRASNGGFAVDDIVIQSGGCKLRPAFAVPPST